MERKNVIKMKDNPLTLVGNELKVGDKAPSFTMVDTTLGEVTLESMFSVPKLISVVPSLDTGVCSLQTKTFNGRIAEMGSKVTAITVSADLPFAQKRFADSENISNISFLSDHRDVNFGENYGLLIKELRLLSRAVIVLDKDNNVVHTQTVPEVTDEPDYNSALEALKKVM